MLKCGLAHLNANAIDESNPLCKCKCTASELNASANALQLKQMQMHLDQMQMHLDQMQMLFCNYVFLRSASDILLTYLVNTINKKTLINNNNKMMGFL